MIRGRRKRHGFVLPLVLMMLLGLTGLAHGTLLLARHQRAAAASGAVGLQARLAAEAGVLRAARDLDGSDLPVLRAGGVVRRADVVFGERVRVASRVVPLGGEWLWVDAEGSADLLGLRGRRRTARVYWLLDPARRAGALRAAVEHGGELAVAPDAEVRGGGPLAAPETWPLRVCEGLHQGSDPAPARLPPAAALHDPDPREPGAVSTYPARVPPLGLMTGELLDERADLRPAAPLGTPSPALRMGACDRARPWNWGEPLEPDGPCGAYRPLVVARDGLTLEGGRGQGVLVVPGDLTLRGTRYVGVVLVGGSLRLDAGARIDGAARVGGGVSVEGGSVIAGSRCAARRALAVRPPPLPPIPASGGSWITLHGG